MNFEIISHDGIIYKSELKELGGNLNYEELASKCVQEGYILLDDTNKKSANSLKWYLQEMAQYDMLTLEEERELGFILLNGDDQEKKEAREKLINANLRLVVSIAKKYFYKTSVQNLDIIQMGNMGLVTAVDKFDVTKGNRFSTFATYWIKQAILRGLSSEARSIRLPENIIQKLNFVNDKRKAYQQENGVNPTDEELSFLTGFPVDEIQLLMNHSKGAISLNAKISDETDDILEDLCPDKSIQTPEDYLSEITNKEIIKTLLATLGDEREAEIIRQRFGLDDNREKSWIEIGQNIGLSHTRVEQLFTKALRKLSSPARKKILERQLYGEEV